MKFIIAICTLLVSTMGFTYDHKACVAYAFERNKTLPESRPPYTSTMLRLECFPPNAVSPGRLVTFMRSKGVDRGVSSETKRDLSSKLKAKMKPIFCLGMQSEYWFADMLVSNYEDAAGRAVLSVPVGRRECR